MGLDYLDNDGVARGSQESADWHSRRNWERSWVEGNAPSSGPSPFPIVAVLLLVVPVLILVVLVTGFTQGAEWLASDSLLAPLFPRDGDSMARYLLSAVTLLVLVPGTLWIAARSVRDRGALSVIRVILVPLAIVLVPVILIATAWTTSIDVLRLPS